MLNPFKIIKAIKSVATGNDAKFVLDEARKTIVSRIKEGRVKFLSDDAVQYTDKNGRKTKYSFEEMTKVFIDVTGQRDNMSKMGLGEWDIEMIFREEYENIKRGE